MPKKRPLTLAYGASLLLNVVFWLCYGHSLRVDHSATPPPAHAGRLAAAPPLPLGLFVPQSRVALPRPTHDGSPHTAPAQSTPGDTAARTSGSVGGPSSAGGGGASARIGGGQGASGGRPGLGRSAGSGAAARSVGGHGAGRTGAAPTAAHPAAQEGDTPGMSSAAGSGAGRLRGGLAGQPRPGGARQARDGTKGGHRQASVAPASSPGVLPASAATNLAAVVFRPGPGRQTSRATDEHEQEADAGGSDTPDMPRPESGQPTPATADVTPHKIVVRVAEVWTPQPGQKFVLPHNLDIQLAPDMKFPRGIRLTPDQMRQLQTLLAQQVNVKVPIDVVRQIYKVAMQALQQATPPKADKPAKPHHVSATPKTTARRPHHATVPIPHPQVAKAESVPRPQNPFHLRPWNVNMLNRFGGADPSPADAGTPAGGAADPRAQPTGAPGQTAEGVRVASSAVPGGGPPTGGTAPQVTTGTQQGTTVAGDTRPGDGGQTTGMAGGQTTGAAAPPNAGQSAGGSQGMVGSQTGASSAQQSGGTDMAGQTTSQPPSGTAGGENPQNGAQGAAGKSGAITGEGMAGGQPGGQPGGMAGGQPGGQPGGMAGGQPGGQPGGMAGGQPGGQPGGMAGGQPGGQPGGMAGGQPGGQPGGMAGGQPGGQPGGMAGGQPGGQPGGMAGGQPGGQPGGMAGGQPGGQPGGMAGGQPGGQPGGMAGGQPGGQPGGMAGGQPGGQPGGMAGGQPGGQPGGMAGGQPGGQPGGMAGGQPGGQPGGMAGGQPGGQPGGMAGGQPGGQPGGMAGGQPGGQPGGMAGGQPGGQPGGMAGGQPGGQPGGMAGGQPGGQPGGMAGGQPGGQPGGMAGGQPGGQPGGMAGGQPGGQPGGMAGGQPGGQPGGMAGGQPGGQPGGMAGGQPGGQPGGMAGGQPGGQPGGGGTPNNLGQNSAGQNSDSTGGQTGGSNNASGAAGGLGLLDGEMSDGEDYLAAEHTDTGAVSRSEGVVPSLPSVAPSGKFNTHPGGLVLPPSPPVGTDTGHAPNLHPVAPKPRVAVLVEALLDRPSAARPPAPPPMPAANQQPRRRVPAPYGRPKKVTRKPTPEGLTTGSASSRGTIWLGAPEADRPYLPIGSVSDVVDPPLADGQAHSTTVRPRTAPAPRKQAPPPVRVVLAVLDVPPPPVPQATTGRTAKPQRNSHGIRDGSRTPLPVTPLPDSITDLGDGSGLKGEYYTGREFDHKVFTRADKVADFDCQRGESPDPRLEPGSDYTVRWTGKIEAPTSGTYTLYVAVDDGARVWINHELMLDAWISQSAREYSGSYTFQAGRQYDLKIEYLEVDGGRASIRLYWEGPGVPKQFIPQSAYFYPLAGDAAALAKDKAP